MSGYAMIGPFASDCLLSLAVSRILREQIRRANIVKRREEIEHTHPHRMSCITHHRHSPMAVIPYTVPRNKILKSDSRHRGPSRYHHYTLSKRLCPTLCIHLHQRQSTSGDASNRLSIPKNPSYNASRPQSGLQKYLDCLCVSC